MYKLYVKRPESVRAIEWKGDNLGEILEFSSRAYIDKDNFTLRLATTNGLEKIEIGDFIVKDPKGVCSHYSKHEFNRNFMRAGFGV